MKHIKQGHNNCGQTCLAMITGHIVEYVSQYLNKRGGTRALDYIRFLESHGFKVINKRFRRCNWETKFPKLCIIKCYNIPKTSYTHVIVHNDGIFHEPEIDKGFPAEIFIPWAKHIRATSYMEIERVEDETSN